MLLPQIDQATLYNQFNPSLRWVDQTEALTTAKLTAFICPSALVPANFYVEPAGSTFPIKNYSRVTYSAAYNGRRMFGSTDATRELVRGPLGAAAPTSRFGARFSDITDGTSQTLLVTETLPGNEQRDLRGAWMLPCALGTGAAYGISSAGATPNSKIVDTFSSCNSILPTSVRDATCTSGNDQDVKIAARSMHVASVNALLCDGSVRTVSDNINGVLWYQLFTISGQGSPAASVSSTDPGQTLSGEF